MTNKKKLILSLLAVATLLPLAGCYSPYYDRDRYGYGRYGYNAERTAPYGDGYNRDGYNRNDGYGYNRDYRDPRDTRTEEGSRPGDPYYDNYTPR